MAPGTQPVEVEQHPVTECAICSASLEGVPATLSVGDTFHVSEQRFSFVRCPGCHTFVLNPRPSMDEMSVFYESDFLANPTAASPTVLRRLASVQQRVNLVSELRWLRRHLSQGARYLDFSAGNGQIVTAVSQSRPDVTVAATEFSAQYRSWIAEQLGTERVRAALNEFPVEARFDLISAFGVLEHVEDPRALIRDLRGRLDGDGKVMLTVPNPQSLQARAAGSRWYSWLAPRHWHLLSLEGLETLLESEGFEVVDHKHFFLRTNSSTAALSLFPQLDPLKPQGAGGLLAYAALFYGLLPVEALTAMVGRGGFMGVVARRRDG